ncbi:glycosyltransferase family 2 protein [Paracraurococcus lichenis]|uniref:Glycosyltransferase family 2 protein n=1 Tax=Paracraurococcus lichenis TaxID=3064888 RepID=A0ABT9DYQ6_9PROT|nr:glycosyltransferase family 2 protein [Paracraurococcus sp. LOR1-02]MDO9709032.1 glycosyltransferase family 2 protein [Paracraurococcus sp. LOR1-02]
MDLLRQRLHRAWRDVWDRLPDELLPLRLRLAVLARRVMGGPPTGRYDPEDRRGYAAWLLRHDRLGAADHAAIQAHIAAMPAGPLISLAMPVGPGIAQARLDRAIESVARQAWPRWELCVALDPAAAPQIRQRLRGIAAKEPRLRLFEAGAGPATGLARAAFDLARGDWVAAMAPDARLAPQALYEVAAAVLAEPDLAVLYTDEDRLDAAGTRFDARFKPEFDPDLLLGQDLLGHLAVYRRALLADLGGLREAMGTAAAHDLALRATRAAGAARVRHIPALLYHGGEDPPPDPAAHLRAVAAALAEAGLGARAEPAPLLPGGVRVVWPVPEPAPTVSVILPTRDRAALLAACAEGLLHRTDYPALEVIIVDNGSEEPETLALFDRLRADPRVRILPVPGPFNYSALNNRAAAEARGEILLLLNNDIEVIEPGWLREMVGHAVRPEVGAVGAKLLYGDGRLQHGGVVTGVGGVADHYLPRVAREDPGYGGSLALVREVAAATAACLALRREVFEAVGGLDEQDLTVAFNDVDLCLKIRGKGWRILWTPFAELYHLESASRGQDVSPEKARRFAGEIATMKRRWGPVLAADPFYSPWLSLDGAHGALARRPRRVPPWAPWIGLSPAPPARPPRPQPMAAPASPAAPVPPAPGPR